MSLTDSNKYISLFAYQCSELTDFTSMFVGQNKLAHYMAHGRLVAIKSIFLNNHPFRASFSFSLSITVACNDKLTVCINFLPVAHKNMQPKQCKDVHVRKDTGGNVAVATSFPCYGSKSMLTTQPAFSPSRPYSVWDPASSSRHSKLDQAHSV